MQTVFNGSVTAEVLSGSLRSALVLVEPGWIKSEDILRNCRCRSPIDWKDKWAEVREKERFIVF